MKYLGVTLPKEIEKAARALRENQKKFCEELVKSENQTEAYLAIYENVKKRDTAAVNAVKLLRNAKVKIYLKWLRKLKQDMVAEENFIDIRRTAVEMARIAFVNPKDFFDDDGNLKNINDIPDEVARAISSFEVNMETDKDTGDVTYTKKLKMWDKTKNLESLGRYLGMFKDQYQRPAQEKIRTLNINFYNMELEELERFVEKLLRERRKENRGKPDSKVKGLLGNG